jgi:hypothetical protein
VKVLAIDPGTTESAFIVWDGEKIHDSGFVMNEVLRHFFSARLEFITVDAIAIEMIACYGMAVGKEVFETCVWIGRFIELAGKYPRLVFRRDIKMHLCNSAKAKDANVSQALRDKHGKKGNKEESRQTLRRIETHLGGSGRR